MQSLRCRQNRFTGVRGTRPGRALFEDRARYRPIGKRWQAGRALAGTGSPVGQEGQTRRAGSEEQHWLELQPGRPALPRMGEEIVLAVQTVNGSSPVACGGAVRVILQVRSDCAVSPATAWLRRRPQQWNGAGAVLCAVLCCADGPWPRTPEQGGKAWCLPPTGCPVLPAQPWPSASKRVA